MFSGNANQGTTYNIGFSQPQQPNHGQEIEEAMMNFSGAQSYNSEKNMFKEIVYNRYPDHVLKDPNFENCMKDQIPQVDIVPDASNPNQSVQIAVDQRLFMKGIKQNPDSDKLYPKQINSFDDVEVRLAKLTETANQITEQKKKIQFELDRVEKKSKNDLTQGISSVKERFGLLRDKMNRIQSKLDFAALK